MHGGTDGGISKKVKAFTADLFECLDKEVIEPGRRKEIKHCCIAVFK